MMTPKQLAAELGRAKRRLEKALAAMSAAERAVVIEQRRINLLEAHQAAGPGHVFTPDPDPTVRTYEPHMRMPECRLCRATISAYVGHAACEGDRHQCQALLPVGVTTPTAFQQYGRSGMLCGQPGSYTADYTSWTCAFGHVTTADHVDDQERCLPTCPCKTMPANDARRW